MDSTYITSTNDRLDKICYAVYGTTDTGQVEAVLAYNPGLEEQGILIPAGVSILLPDTAAPATTTPVVTQIKLWQ